jgi:pimeloyl-ACP methyl ester carboxylesterase
VSTATDSVWTEESTSRFAQLGDLRVHYNDAGEGPPVVLLHGAGPGATSWSNFRGNVPELAARHRLLLVDQPGFGKSDKPAVNEPMFTFFARAVRDLLDELDIERASFIGNSLGGGTTLKFALDFPDRADKLICMAPGGGAMPVLAPWDVGTKVGGLLADFFGAPSKEKMLAFFDQMLYDKSFVTDELLEERFQAATAPGMVEGMMRLFLGDGSPRAFDPKEMELWRDIHEIQHETLLIWGRDDQILPLDGSFFMLKRMSNARLHVLPRCGHWAQVEHSDEFNRVTLDFLGAAS